MCSLGSLHAFFLSTYIVSMRKCELLVDAIRNEHHPRHSEYAHLDADLIEQISSHFSRLYLEALARDHDAADNTATNPWRIAFRFSDSAGATPDRCILLGLVAHSCHDLPIILSLPVDSNSRIYDPRNPKHRITYRRICGLLSEELPGIATNLWQTGRVMRSSTGVASVCLFPWVYRLGDRLVVALVHHLLRRVQQEALWNSMRLRRGSITTEQLEEISVRRLKSLCGRFLPLRLTWLLLRTAWENRRRSLFKGWKM